MRHCLPLLLLLTFSLETPASSTPHKVRAVGLMALYGTVGGGLLGVSSMAFGAGGRTVAKGASLGLYLGLIFGSYVVFSHNRNDRDRDPGDSDYGERLDSGSGGGGGWFEFGGGTSRGRWPRLEQRYRELSGRERFFSPAPQVHLNLFDYRF